MRLIDQVYKSIHEYSSLYWHKDHPTMSDFEISRMAVLQHLFSTLGNGYCWVDGYMCDISEAEGAEYSSNGWVTDGPAYGQLQYTERYWPPKRKGNYEHAWEYLESWKEPGLFQMTVPDKWPFSIYGYQYIKVPDFIQPDWAEGLREFLIFAIEYYKDKESRDGNFGKIPWSERRKAIPHLRKLLKKVEAQIVKSK